MGQRLKIDFSSIRIPNFEGNDVQDGDFSLTYNFAPIVYRGPFGLLEERGLRIAQLEAQLVPVSNIAGERDMVAQAKAWQLAVRSEKKSPFRPDRKLRTRYAAQ